MTTVISIDAMSGDKGPAPVLAGLERVAGKRGDLRFLLHGRPSALEPLLKRRQRLAALSEVRAADSVVPMDAQPSKAIRSHRDSSMWGALKAVADGEAGVAVSAGNTGALMAMAVLCLRKAPGVARPAIAVHWPAARPEGYNTVLDVGADVRADPHHLAQYALMGAEYARVSLGAEHPRVGLLNLGTEPTKGPPELREAAALIEAAAASGERFAYTGFVEGADICRDRVEVIVTDGFTGNIALKTAEGTATLIRETLRQAFRATVLAQLSALLAQGPLRRLSRRIDPRRVNGGVFLGLDGAVVKSHGGADAVGFAAAVGLAVRMAESDFPAHVARELARLHLSGPAPKGSAA
ncbi:MAG: phosphate acyltransferase PlsX [Pseudomonadota bacterium]